MQKTFNRYPKEMQQTFNRYSKDIQKIFKRYSKDIQQIFKRYSTNIQKISKRNRASTKSNSDFCWFLDPKQIVSFWWFLRVYLNQVFGAYIYVYIYIYIYLGKFHHDRALFSLTGIMVRLRGIIPKWPNYSGEREILFHLPRHIWVIRWISMILPLVPAVGVLGFCRESFRFKRYRFWFS